MLLCIVFGKRRNIYVFWDIVLISIISFIYCISLQCLDVGSRIGVCPSILVLDHLSNSIILSGTV